MTAGTHASDCVMTCTGVRVVVGLDGLPCSVEHAFCTMLGYTCLSAPKSFKQVVAAGPHLVAGVSTLTSPSSTCWMPFGYQPGSYCACNGI